MEDAEDALTAHQNMLLPNILEMRSDIGFDSAAFAAVGENRRSARHRKRSDRIHTYGTKMIPSGFFFLPGAENVSAVIFTNAGTIAKFDRIGVLAGYGPPKHRYMRIGFRYDPDPNATEGKRFAEEVGKDGYNEGWADEIKIFHSPNAMRPLPPGLADCNSSFSTTAVSGPFMVRNR